MKHQYLLKLIVENKYESISELVSLNMSSESTIRRNLKKLEEAGYIEMYYGGKFEIIKNDEVSLKDEFKTNLNKAQKNRLGKLCGDLVKHDEVIFIDNGTTIRNIFRHIKNKNTCVYTNGLNHISEAAKYNIDLKIIPGNILYKEGAAIGEDSLMYLSDTNFDAVFVGANGFDEEKGITTPNHSEANLKRFVLTRGDRSYVVMDSNKYKLVSKFKICDFEKYPIITIPLSCQDR